MLYPVILGLNCIEISRLLGHNGVFKLLIGLNRFPNPTTLRRFLIRGSEELLPQFVRLHDQLRKYFINLIVPEKKLLIDLDSTICTVYSHQEGAMKGYNPVAREGTNGVDNRYSFAETFYQPTKWNQPYRYCIVRKRLEPEESDQSTLFTINAYSYSAIVTNLTMMPANIWKFYNGRAQCERNIRSLKEDYYLGNISTQKFKANGLYLEILLWAYDLVKWFQRLCLSITDHNKTLETLRNELLLIPGSFAQHGSRQILRFPRNSPQQKTFWYAKDKITKLKNLNDMML